MMAEANRILDECMLMPQPRRRKRLSRLAAFLVGVLVGAAALLGAALLL
jgi:predicted nucleic acid-binding Zn ribbon protein